MINTTTVKNRRAIRFATIADALADLDVIEKADREGRLQPLGNWTPGQNLAHVAAWINYAYDGFPMPPAPWFVRLFLWFQKRSILRGAMGPGVKIPQLPEGTTGQDRIGVAEGVERLRTAFRRLASDEPAPHPSPAFGPLTKEERVELNLRHAELHLSFIGV